MSDSDKDEPRDSPLPALQEDGSLLIRKLPNGDQLVASKGWVSMTEDEAYVDLPELFLVECGDEHEVFSQALFPDEATATAWANGAPCSEGYTTVTVMRGSLKVRSFRVPVDKGI